MRHSATAVDLDGLNQDIRATDLDIERKTASATAIIDDYKARGVNVLTDASALAIVNDAYGNVDALTARRAELERARTAAIERLGENGAIGDPQGLYAAIMAAQFDIASNHRVMVAPGIGLFASVTAPSGDSLGTVPRRLSPIQLAADRRWLFPALMLDTVSDTTTAVERLKQTSRTLADPDDMIRDIDQTSPDKPETDITIELVSDQLKQIAHVVSGVPNIVIRQPVFAGFVNGDLQLGLNEALDAHAFDEILAASVGEGGDAYVDHTLAGRIRQAITAVDDAGYSADTIALTTGDAERLDIEALTLLNSTGASPYFGLRPRVSKGLTQSLVFDSRSFATLHLGPTEFASFEENEGKSNSQTLRAELNALVVVDRADAAAFVAETSN